MSKQRPSIMEMFGKRANNLLWIYYCLCPKQIFYEVLKQILLVHDMFILSHYKTPITYSNSSNLCEWQAQLYEVNTKICVIFQGRIKKIMQSDEEVGKVAQAVPVIIYILLIVY